jgi:hypothetical protein
MTESEWLACAEPVAMGNWARKRLSVRQLRLYAVASCRRAWHLLPDERCRAAVLAAEAWADRRVDRGTLRTACEAADACFREFPLLGEERRQKRQLAWAARLAASRTRVELMRSAYFVVEALAPDNLRPVHDLVQADLLREVAGPLFAPPADMRRWQTRDIVALAESIYEERAFGQMSVLADALEDAGCSDAILAHCRSGKPHVRGCWLIDLLRAKR